MRVLGVTCSTHTAFLAVSDDGVLVEGDVQKIEVGALNEASAELDATLDEIGRAISQIRPDLIVLLLPEQSRFKRTYGEIAPRVALETLVRLAAVRGNTAIEILARPTVRSRLGLPRTGDLASHVAGRIPQPVGSHWSAGRNVAALAALAGEEGT